MPDNDVKYSRCYSQLEDFDRPGITNIVTGESFDYKFGPEIEIDWSKIKVDWFAIREEADRQSPRFRK